MLVLIEMHRFVRTCVFVSMYVRMSVQICRYCIERVQERVAILYT